MSTNYYWITGSELPEDSPLVHIGKRSLAGKYCANCGTTLCLHGITAVHDGSAVWSDVCPICGGPGERTSSFTWTMLLHRSKLEGLAYSTKPCVRDEYGVELTPAYFLVMVQDMCRIELQCPGEWE